MMSLDLKKELYDVHPSFVELGRTTSMSISDSTLERLAGKVHSLNQEKKQRLRKVFIFVASLINCISQNIVHIVKEVATSFLLQHFHIVRLFLLLFENLAFSMLDIIM